MAERLCPSAQSRAAARRNWWSIERFAKDVVKFNSEDPEVFSEWVLRMNKEGYEVEYYYDEKNRSLLWRSGQRIKPKSNHETEP